MQVFWLLLAATLVVCGVSAIDYTVNSFATQPPVDTVISFDASADFDSVASPSYAWSFGDGRIETTLTPTVQHRYQAIQGFLDVSVTLSDGDGVVRTATLELPLRGFPSFEIELPVDAAGFRASQTLTARASGTDSLNRRIADDAIQYTVQLEEGGVVTQTIAPTTTSPYTFVTPASPSSLDVVDDTLVVVNYRFEDTVDGATIVATRSRRIPPELLSINLRTQPAGNQVSVYGMDLVTSPAQVQVWKGSTMLIGAAPPDGFEFESWSDGGSVEHLISIPQTQAELGNALFTVTYEPVGSNNEGDPTAIFAYEIISSTITPRTNNTCPPADIEAVASFDATLSFAEGGTDDNLAYLWNFGDGSPSATGLQVQHTFLQQGIFNVTLTVTDSRTSGVDTQTQQVPIRGVPCVTLMSPTGEWKAGETVLIEAAGFDSLNRPLSTLGYGAGLTVGDELTGLDFENEAPPFQVTMPSSTTLEDVDRTFLTIVIQGSEDFGGVQQSVQQTFLVEPKIIFFSMQTSPVQQRVIVYDDQNVLTPYNLPGWAGAEITIKPSPPQTYKFVRWWNDGPETQTLTVPDEQTDVPGAYTAFYALDELALLEDWIRSRPDPDDRVTKLKNSLRDSVLGDLLDDFGFRRRRRFLKGSA